MNTPPDGRRPQEAVVALSCAASAKRRTASRWADPTAVTSWCRRKRLRLLAFDTTQDGAEGLAAELFALVADEFDYSGVCSCIDSRALRRRNEPLVAEPCWRARVVVS